MVSISLTCLSRMIVYALSMPISTVPIKENQSPPSLKAYGREREPAPIAHLTKANTTSLLLICASSAVLTALGPEAAPLMERGALARATAALS